MSRPRNPENKYNLIDAVTGETLHTNPKQFRDLCARFSLTPEQLQTSYVGQKGRNQLANDHETVESAMQKYGLHINVASKLKALRPKASKTAKAHSETETAPENSSIEVPADAINSETPAETSEPDNTSISEEVPVGVTEDEEVLV